jgi:4-hydroxy-tetrahydrodipicolinate synthase
MTLPLLASGAAGVIGVATHWTGLDHQDLFDLWGKGDVVGARLVNSRLLESFAFETGDEAPNPLPTKAMLRVLGLAVGEARLPMGPGPAGLEDRAREVLANLERWRDAFPGRPDRQPG